MFCRFSTARRTVFRLPRAHLFCHVSSQPVLRLLFPTPDPVLALWRSSVELCSSFPALRASLSFSTSPSAPFSAFSGLLLPNQPSPAVSALSQPPTPCSPIIPPCPPLKHHQDPHYCPNPLRPHRTYTPNLHYIPCISLYAYGDTMFVLTFCIALSLNRTPVLTVTSSMFDTFHSIPIARGYQ